jgi:hypothetical protein
VPSLEFVVEASETTLVVDTARAAAGDALDAVCTQAEPSVMRAVMSALERKEHAANASQV